MNAKYVENAAVKDKTPSDAEHDDGKPLSLEEVAEISYFCRCLEEKLCSLYKNDTIKIVIDESVYNYKGGTTESFLTVVEIRQMLRTQWLNVVTLQIWGSNHWMLIVTCLGIKNIYILDSNQKTSKKLYIKGRLHAAWILHCAQGGRRNFANSKLIIKVIECPQQPKGYECGYYVMKWMYNITFYYSTGKEKDFEKLMADSSMSLDDIDEIKEVWATKCLNNM
ncbi:hypothetical protein KSS87_016423 [Heliosperma pusillum]|nr:hypothetical protein KSS87_016423 [Heliosperma pusillum]